MKGQLPPFLEEMLATCPKAGEGVHIWLFKVARQLHAHLPAIEIIALLERATANCERVVPQSEIVAAVENSIECAWQPTGKGSPPIHTAPKWPVLNREQREAIRRDSDGVVALWENSPVQIEDSEPHTEEIIDQLFPGDPLLCCGLSSTKFETRLRSEWLGRLARLQLIVPNPMTACIGPTKEGKESAHALSITGPRRFLVIEFDQGDLDDHAALLWHLALKAPLALVVHSGSRSLHGWFFCEGQPEEYLHKVMRYCVSLGACTSTWTHRNSSGCPMACGTTANGRPFTTSTQG